MFDETDSSPGAGRARTGRTAGLAFALALAAVASSAHADVPGRPPPRGTVPNPGTQQQELANITFPAPYNVFEFTVTCAGCHGGTIDQQNAQFGVQGGSNMASAARDPVFRANQIATNDRIKAVTTVDGAGNMCMRCHSPNGWYSGRFDPTLAGDAQGKTMLHSIVASTDDEGISCETCHRAVGNVKFKRIGGLPNATDPAWNKLAGVSDWTHAGAPIDNINPGDPYGDTTLQYADGMNYGGPYPGVVAPSFSDDQNLFATTNVFPGFNIGTYTGQIFAVYPPGYSVVDKFGVPGPDLGGLPVKNADGSISQTFDRPVGAPYVHDAAGNVVIDPVTRQPLVDLQAQSLSIEHPTFQNKFLTSSEMCASCHELTVPVANHGMPEQRTFTEWKYSAYAKPGAFTAGLPGTPALEAGATKTFNSVAGEIRCQDCHMPKVKHEYDDISPVSLNADPVLVGWFPYAKDRNNTGGTSNHKHAGANRDLPDYMKLLYPEPDLEIVGTPTGNDIRIVPGMLSTRDPMFDRARRNTEVSMRDGVGLEIVRGPAATATAGVYEVVVKVTNRTGHKIPSGYPDGRRLFISLDVKDAAGASVYTSGAYDAATADLLTAPGVPFNRALGSTVDATIANAVMVYERVTCKDNFLVVNTPGTCAPGTAGPDLLNNAIMFDNRIPPAGFDYPSYQTGGARFWSYDPATLAYFEDATRYPNGQGFDLVTYRFASASAPVSARATASWQTHTREFMEHLRTQDASAVRPEGPVNPFMVGYPLTPSYLSDVVINRASGLPWWSGPSGTTWADFTLAQLGASLNDNWGGVAYAAWALTGKGAPYTVATADTTVTALPAAPASVSVLQPGNDPFETQISWAAVAGPVDGYEVWIRYGLDTTGATASWDKLAVVDAATLAIVNTAMNLGKTYGFSVRAFNSMGAGPFSAAASYKTAWDLPLPPDALAVAGTPTATTVGLTWLDTADNETGFKVQLQVVTVNGAVVPVLPFADYATFATQTGGAPGAGALMAFGGNAVTLTGLQPSTCYNFQVYAYNATGPSAINTNGPVRACTSAPAPASPVLGFSAVGTTTATLAWSNVGATGYSIRQVAPAGAAAIPAAAALTWNLAGLLPGTAYTFAVDAVGAGGTTPSNAVSFTTLALLPPATPAWAATALKTAVKNGLSTVTLAWTNPAASATTSAATGVLVERATAAAGPWTGLPNTNVAGPFVDATVLPNTRYYYRLTASNAEGTLSAPSAATSIVSVNVAPTAPTALAAGRVTKTAVLVTWTNTAANATGLVAQVFLGGKWVTKNDALAPATAQYSFAGLKANTGYQFRIGAYNTVNGRTRPVWSAPLTAKTAP